ncbi:MAG TPA: VOC family protein [Panacibacter sp.]|nr:VOC family protein [Panacibacter sp.]HNP46017.1 VOC family protein [Panacibacter sp.]
MTIKQANITINVKDMYKSIAFYESIGLVVKARWDNYYAQLVAPGIVIGIHPAKDNTTNANSGNISIGFTVDNFDEAKSLLENMPVQTTERQEEGGQFLHFTDPDGIACYFIKPKW